jgi:hypothetical protein
VALSFNCGKDSTVALHILRAASIIYDKRNGGTGDSFKKIKFAHFVKPNEFPEISTFRS